MFTNLARRAGAAYLVATLTVLGSQPSAAADGPLVKTVAPTEQELRDDGKHPEYHFGLTPADGVDPATLRAYVVRVSAGGHADAGLIPAFSTEVKDVPNLGPALVVRVDFDLAAAPGTYEVEVALSDLKHGAVKQSVTVRLVHAAAKIAVPARLVLSRSWFLRPLGQFPTTLTVEETSRHSRLTGLLAMQVPPAIHDDEPVDGQLALTSPTAIPPGAIAALPLSIEGSFPLGVTRGKIQVRAPQLEAPSVVDYEIRVRMPTWVIPMLFLAGAAIGYLVRVRLKSREEKLTRSLRARDLCDRLGHLEEKSKPEDQVVLWNLVKEIADSEGGGPVFEAAMKKAEEQLATMTEARATAQRTLVADAGRALSALARGWTLPAAVDPAPVAKAFTESQHKAVADDLIGAEAASSSAADLTRALTRTARGWATSVERHLVKLEEAKPPPQADLATAATELRAALAKLPAEDADPAIEPLLHAVHAANTTALALVDRVASALADAAEDAGRAAPNHAGAIHAAAKMGEPKTPTDAEEALARLTETARGLHEAVSKVVLSLMPTAPADRAAVQGLLAEHRHAEAIERAKSAAEPALVSSFSDEGDDQPPPLPPPPRRFPALFARTTVPAMGGETSVIMLATPAAGHNERLTEERQLGETRTTLMVISATIMALLTWALYSRQFYGTSSELVSLFALGFTTDVSADALFAALDKASKKK